MTEQEWLGCTDPRPMLEFLSGTASDRRLRLLACACCRRIWTLFRDGRSIRAVEAAEQYADGLIDNNELTVASQAADEFAHLAARESGVSLPSYDLNFGALCVLHFRLVVDTFASYAAYHAASRAPDWVLGTYGQGAAAIWVFAACLEYAAWATASASTAKVYSAVASTDDETATRKAQFESAVSSEGMSQAALLRDIFGNPFRPVAFDAAWWTPSITAVGRMIYEERRFADMPILADALEEAGCTSADMLDHCRQPGEHVRGCWVVDLVLGKE